MPQHIAAHIALGLSNMPLQKVSGREFQWSVERATDAYEALLYYPGPDRIDVLRIDEVDIGFSVAIRIDSDRSSDGAVQQWLGPMLIRSQRFVVQSEAVVQGVLIELRPKVRRLKCDEPHSATVERVIQWCFSPHFRVRRINPVGGRWVGYGH